MPRPVSPAPWSAKFQVLAAAEAHTASISSAINPPVTFFIVRSP
jgi:hypothetical protein